MTLLSLCAAGWHFACAGWTPRAPHVTSDLCLRDISLSCSYGVKLGTPKAKRITDTMMPEQKGEKNSEGDKKELKVSS